MLYNEEKNVDYINMKLKRLATDDEVNTLNCFWKELLPYRYLNSFYKKLFKKELFSDKVYKRIKIKRHYLTVKSASIEGENEDKIYSGKSLKSIATDGVDVNAISILTSSKNKNDLNEIGYYYNSAGVPITCAITNYDVPFSKTDVFSLSLAKSKNIKKQKIKNRLNIIVVGLQTKFDEKNTVNSFMQKKLLDFSREVINNNLTYASKTCENGLFSAIVKLIKKGKWGIYINIDNLREFETNHDVHAWQALTTINNERLIFAVYDRKLVDFINLIDKYELPFSIIGKIDKSKSVKVIHKGKMVIDLPKKIIFNPIIKVNKANYVNEPTENEVERKITTEDLGTILVNENFKSSKNLFLEYDSTIGNKTCVSMQENGVSELWFEEIKHYISTSTHSLQLQANVNPYIAGQNLVCETLRKIVALGHKPFAISVLCSINFSKQGEISRFDEVRKGIFYAAKKLKIKVLNLNIINNETESSFSVFGVGKKKDKQKTVVPYFDYAQNIYLIGKLDNLPSTSLYQKILRLKVFSNPDEVNYKFEKKLYKCLRKLQKENLVSACISVDKMGIASAMTKALAPRKLGFKVIPTNLNLEYFFNEVQSRYIVASNDEIEAVLNKYKIPYIKLGKTKSADYIEMTEIKFECKDFYEKYYQI